MVKAKKIFSNIYLILIFIFLYAPIFALALFSFNDSKSMARWQGFTFKWYQQLFHNDRIISALITTVVVAILASAIATVIGTISAIGIDRMRGPKKAMLLNINYLPVLNPDIVTAIGLMILFIFFNMKLGFLTMLLAHKTRYNFRIFNCFYYVYR